MAEDTTPPAPATEATGPSLAGEARQRKVFIGISVLVLLLVAVAVVVLHDPSINPKTDDAQVDGHLVVVSPRVAGHVARILIDDNYVVQKNDLLVELDPRDYAVEGERAQAALENACAKAEVAKRQISFSGKTTSTATLGSNTQIPIDEA